MHPRYSTADAVAKAKALCSFSPSFGLARSWLWRSAAGGWPVQWLMRIWMAAICAACVLTKQHNILDIPAGIAVGSSAVTAAGAVLRRFERTDSSAETAAR